MSEGIQPPAQLLALLPVTRRYGSVQFTEAQQTTWYTDRVDGAVARSPLGIILGTDRVDSTPPDGDGDPGGGLSLKHHCGFLAQLVTTQKVWCAAYRSPTMTVMERNDMAINS